MHLRSFQSKFKCLITLNNPHKQQKAWDHLFSRISHPSAGRNFADLPVVAGDCGLLLLDEYDEGRNLSLVGREQLVELGDLLV